MTGQTPTDGNAIAGSFPVGSLQRDKNLLKASVEGFPKLFVTLKSLLVPKHIWITL